MSFDRTPDHKDLTVPSQLFSLVFSNLSKAELKPLRFAERNFIDWVIPSLFDKIYTSPSQLNLDVCWNTSQRPHLAKRVKELVYDATLFQQNISAEKYKAELQTHASTNWNARGGFVLES